MEKMQEGSTLYADRGHLIGRTKCNGIEGGF